MTQQGTTAGDYVVAVDDISFLNCETYYQPPGKEGLISITILYLCICGMSSSGATPSLCCV